MGTPPLSGLHSILAPKRRTCTMATDWPRCSVVSTMRTKRASAVSLLTRFDSTPWTFRNVRWNTARLAIRFSSCSTRTSVTPRSTRYASVTLSCAVYRWTRPQCITSGCRTVRTAMRSFLTWA
ncbi:gp19.2 [Klebsiella phage K11]|uniref:Gp19.2 n=1 Tax=Enterobacteria phage K11 TaxID=532077 RepID=B3VD26_BPK11|nr:gp19.2 [Klebsiella phage K11]ACF15881.1 gp19.2 [Klebsiella phage K11]